MYFCKLPPDRLRASACGPPAFTWKRAMMAAARCAMTLWRRKPWRMVAGVCKLNNTLSASAMSGTAPRPSRSSGTKPKPRARRRPGGKRPAGVPFSTMLAAAARMSSPDRAASNSCWPLPDTPAMPTISPARTSKLISVNCMAKGWLFGRSSRRTLSMAAPGVRAARVTAAGSAPIIMRDRLAADSCEGSHTPTFLPARTTVHVWHRARISSSLWLM